MIRTAAGFAFLALLSGCSREPQESPIQAPSRHTEPVRVEPPPRPTIDPKSSEAAEDLVRGFIRLLNQGRFADAYMLLGPNAPPRAQFDREWTSYSDLKVKSGLAGSQDGAAGSIYVSVPLTISGKLRGEEVNRSATAVLRRVNDVPGSTEAQRRWHIERVDFGK